MFFLDIVKSLFLIWPFEHKPLSFFFFLHLSLFSSRVIDEKWTPPSQIDTVCINQDVPRCRRWWLWPRALRPGGGFRGGVAASLTSPLPFRRSSFRPTPSHSVTMARSHSIPFPFLQGPTKSATIYAPGMDSSSLWPASPTSGALHGNNRGAHPHAAANRTSYLRVLSPARSRQIKNNT